MWKLRRNDHAIPFMIPLWFLISSLSLSQILLKRPRYTIYDTLMIPEFIVVLYSQKRNTPYTTTGHPLEKSRRLIPNQLPVEV